MSVLGKILPNVMFVDKTTSDIRTNICQHCEFRKKNWCGTPVFGDTITQNEVKVKLCGCFLPEKIELKNQNCPLKKW